MDVILPLIPLRLWQMEHAICWRFIAKLVSLSHPHSVIFLNDYVGINAYSLTNGASLNHQKVIMKSLYCIEMAAHYVFCFAWLPEIE